MNAPSPNKLEDDLVLVAAAEWCDRIAHQLRWPADVAGSGRVVRCSSVYEATAEVVELLAQPGRSAVVCVMVDYLAAQEMRIFACLVRMSRVRTVAVSAFGQRKKLMQAQALGADELLVLEGRSETPGGAEQQTVTVTKSESSVDEPSEPAGRPEPAAPSSTTETVKDSLVQMVAQAIDSVGQTHEEKQPPTEGSDTATPTPPADKQAIEPVLTKEELDALLG